MSDTPSFLAETPAETAEFESVRDGTAVETSAPPPEPDKPAESAPEPPKPAPAPEPPKPAEPAKPDERKPTFVPHAALHEERLKRQALEKELADLRAGRQPEVQEQEEIDPEKDPIAALKQIKAHQQQQREQGEREQQVRAFEQRVQTHEADFAAATPDYAAAISHLRDTRAREIVEENRILGRAVTQEQLAAQLRHEVLTVANTALMAGKNPGEAFYEISKLKGYAQKAAEPAPAPAPAPPSQQAVETIERLTRGHKAAKVGGGDPPSGGGEVTLEALAKLEGAAFDSAFEKFSRAQRSVH